MPPHLHQKKMRRLPEQRQLGQQCHEAVGARIPDILLQPAACEGLAGGRQQPQISPPGVQLSGRQLLNVSLRGGTAVASCFAASKLLLISSSAMTIQRGETSLLHPYSDVMPPCTLCNTLITTSGRWGARQNVSVCHRCDSPIGLPRSVCHTRALSQQLQAASVPFGLQVPLHPTDRVTLGLP